MSVLILVLLVVGFITVIFYVDYLLTHLCFTAFLSLCIVLIDALIYSAARVFNKLTYLLTYLMQCLGLLCAARVHTHHTYIYAT